ncbi:MAG: hypothetical protein JW741_12130 [Sedimentisphaerales bacterium]|nr:hypothetical protein [Sedimentisphaerales bacterium]
MFETIRSRRLLFVVLIATIFALHFAAAVACGRHPSIRVNDAFNRYLEPGLRVLTLYMPRSWWQGNLLGAVIYFENLVLYSGLYALALFAGYGVFTGVRAWWRVWRGRLRPDRPC